MNCQSRWKKNQPRRKYLFSFECSEFTLDLSFFAPSFSVAYYGKDEEIVKVFASFDGAKLYYLSLIDIKLPFVCV